MGHEGGVRRAVWALLFVATYIAAGRLGLSLAFANESASAVWPPTGLAIAGLLLGGLRLWPAVTVGAFLVNFSANGHLPSSLTIAAGNTLEAVVAAALLLRVGWLREGFASPSGVLAFAVFAGLLAPLVSATIGVGSLVAFGLLALDVAPGVWGTWWAGDVAGALIVAPPLLLWAGARPGSLWRAARDRAWELVALSLALVGTAALVFGSPAADWNSLAFLALVPVVWAAVSFGLRGASVTALTLSALATSGTLAGRGPFATSSPDLSLALLQGFFAVTGLVGLVFASVDAGRASAVRALDAARLDLERRVEERTRELREALERIAASEALLRKSQEIAKVGSWDWDVRNDTIRWSEELFRIFGISPEGFEPSFEGYLSLLPEADREPAQRVVAEALQNKAPFAFDHSVLRPDGELRPVRGRGEAILDAEGNVTHMVGTAQDITEAMRIERERAEAAEREAELQRLRETDEFRAHLLSAVSHELKTPLTPLKMQVEMLRTGILGPLSERQQRSVGILARNLARLESLVEQTLDVGRIEQGRVRIAVRLVEVEALVDDVMETFQDLAAQRHVRVEKHVEPGLTMEADAARITQVLVNLVSNAVKFSPEGGRVRIAARREGNDVELRVEDEGPGIEPAERARLFQAFSQLASGEDKGGTGLGLYISRGIVEAHGGAIGADVPTGGQGAAFWFRMPAAPRR